MFYTIVDNTGRLVIVDGGFEGNADAVRNVIKQHNNHVTAWIITHPHPDHLCNDGSMMFKVSGRKKSMLFCADVQSEMEPYILASYRNQLHADYVQLGHHGNWGLTTDFYDVVNPSAVFFDGPRSLIDDESGKYDGYLLRNYFAAKGIPEYRFTTAPNTVVVE